MRPVPKGAPYVIDKLPANFQSIGLIHMALPQARIIHIERNPLETCFSIYRNYFSQNEPFFCSQREIGTYHNYYRDTMKHWQQVLPGRVFDVQYEALAGDTESVMRDVLAHCTLLWSENVITPARQGGHVLTLSNTQVREGIRSADGDRASRYGEYLQELQDTLASP